MLWIAMLKWRWPTFWLHTIPLSIVQKFLHEVYRTVLLSVQHGYPQDPVWDKARLTSVGAKIRWCLWWCDVSSLVDCEPGSVLRQFDFFYNETASFIELDVVPTPPLGMYNCYLCGTREYKPNRSTGLPDNCAACWGNSTPNTGRTYCGRYLHWSITFTFN